MSLQEFCYVYRQEIISAIAAENDPSDPIGEHELPLWVANVSELREMAVNCGVEFK